MAHERNAIYSSMNIKYVCQWRDTDESKGLHLLLPRHQQMYWGVGPLPRV
jgi:hypothetical protein